MKKKFVMGNRVPILAVTLVSLALFWRGGVESRAREGEVFPAESLVRMILLNSDEPVQVPRRIVEGNVVYELDESSISVEAIGYGSAEGADVVTLSRKMEGLSDNDLEGIEKRIVSDGISYDLLSVAYKVEEEGENGRPLLYSAVCEYGGLKKYATSYPTAWQMSVRYDFRGEMPSAEIVEIQEIVERQEETGPRDGLGAWEVAEREEDDGAQTKRVPAEDNGGEEAKEPSAEAAERTFQIKPEREEEDGKAKILDSLIPLAAATAGTGVTAPFIIWFSVLTAPIFGMKRAGKYRYIGRIRLKKEDGGYAAYLTKRLLARAELPVFQIKLPEKVRKKCGAGELRINCPGGKRIMATVGKVVHFTVEGD